MGSKSYYRVKQILLESGLDFRNIAKEEMLGYFKECVNNIEQKYYVLVLSAINDIYGEG